MTNKIETYLEKEIERYKVRHKYLNEEEMEYQRGIIKFNKPVYKTIWTGEVDKILSYDTDNLEFTVQNVITGEIRTHMTNMDALYMSTQDKPYSEYGRKQAVEYMIQSGLPTRAIDNLKFIL